MTCLRRGSQSLDDTDRAIIEQLQQDGRLSYTGVAAATQLSDATVRQRIQRLMETCIYLGPAKRTHRFAGHHEHTASPLRRRIPDGFTAARAQGLCGDISSNSPCNRAASRERVHEVVLNVHARLVPPVAASKASRSMSATPDS